MKPAVTPTIDFDLATLLTDARIFRRLAVEGAPPFSLALAPYVAMFAVESLAFLKHRKIVTGSFGDHAAAIERSRHSLKFLDDSNGGVAGVIDRFEQMGRANHQMFNGSHGGLLGPLKRLLQPDLSIFISEGRMVGTSHSAMVQTFSGQGSPPTTLAEFHALGPELFERSAAVGRLIGAVMKAFNFKPDPNSSSAALPPMTARDAKSDRFYRGLVRSAESARTGWAILVASLLSSTNFVLHALPMAAGRDVIDRSGRAHLIWPFCRGRGLDGDVPETARRDPVVHARSACGSDPHPQAGRHPHRRVARHDQRS